MTKIIDTGLTDHELFEQLLAAVDFPDYDPRHHLLVGVAAGRWNLSEKAALMKLRKHAPEYGMTETRVRLDNGHLTIAFTKG